MNLVSHAAGIALAATLTAPIAAIPATASTAPPARSTAASAATPTTTTPSAATPAATAHARHLRQRQVFEQRTMHVAARYRGVPYRSGGTTPRGFDCSGYVRYVFAQLDHRLPRSSREQYRALRRVRHPQIGDLIFFHSGRNGSVYHVAIYAGHGMIWHSTHPGEGVRKTRIYSRYWTAGRI